MKKMIAIVALALSSLALSGCDGSPSDDNRFTYNNIGLDGYMQLMVDHYAHKYYLVNEHGGAPLEISAEQAGKYADQTPQAYHEPDHYSDLRPDHFAQPLPTQQPVAPVIINNRND